MSHLNCPSVSFDLRFDQDFKVNAPYLRNNRSNGVKSLRCFPTCSDPHHVEAGFCGQPITALLTVFLQKNLMHTLDISKLNVVGEFQPFDKNNYDGIQECLEYHDLIEGLKRKIPTRKDIALGCKAPRFYLYRSQELQSPSWTDTIDPNTKQCSIELMFKAKSWNYQRLLIKHKNANMHAFYISILSNDRQFQGGRKQQYFPGSETALLIRLAQFRSPGFFVACTRRTKNLNDEDSTPGSLEAKEKSELRAKAVAKEEEFDNACLHVADIFTFQTNHPCPTCSPGDLSQSKAPTVQGNELTRISSGNPSSLKKANQMNTPRNSPTSRNSPTRNSKSPPISSAIVSTASCATVCHPINKGSIAPLNEVGELPGEHPIRPNEPSPRSLSDRDSPDMFSDLEELGIPNDTDFFPRDRLRPSNLCIDDFNTESTDEIGGIGKGKRGQEERGGEDDDYDDDEKSEVDVEYEGEVDYV